MTVTIAVAGKGGTGKTTFSGLLIRHLVQTHAGRVLAIGHVDIIGLLLMMAVLFWIPTHILTFSMRYVDDYQKAHVPTFCSDYGFEATRAIIALSAIIAAASIAQVHHATTKGGREVAVKIQRQGLKRILDSDIEILRFFARLWQTVHKQDLPRRRRQARFR